MLKHDVLDIVHSKVRWYAIHQIKKVCFQLNPHLYQTEDLKGAVHELQFVPDFNETQRLESEVYGENYGRKYPSFTIHNMKEYKFWPFVAGSDWKRCSSLRVTPGSLLSNLMETYRELEKEGKILRFTTDVYENVLTYKPQGCLRKAISTNLSPTDTVYTPSTDNNTEDIADTHLEMSKISFTYYGISMSHLKKILSEAGIDDVSDEQIADQNPAFFPKEKLRSNVPLLCDLVKVNDPPLIKSSVELEEGPNSNMDLNEYHDMAGRQRKLAKRKFTEGQVCWVGKQAANSRVRKTKENTLLNPINRRIMLERIHEQRAKNRRRIEFHENVNKSIKASNGAYEKWWLKQIDNPLMSSGAAYPSSHQTFFGNSWIIDGSFSLSDKKVVQKTPQTRKGKKNNEIPDKSQIVETKKPLVITNLNAIDTWRCICDVCTGNLLNILAATDNRAQNGYVTTRSRGQDRKVENAESEEDRGKVVQEEVKPDVNFQKNDDKNKKTKKNGSKKKKKGGKSFQAGKTPEKPKLNPKIWWETVSTYTTPKWQTQEDQENQETKKRGRRASRLRKSAMAQKLNVTYSFEKLRQRRNSVSVKQVDESGDRASSLSRKSIVPAEAQSVTSSQISKAPSKESNDTVNMDALIAHRIIYQHTPAQCKPYTRIHLPALRGLNLNSLPKRMTKFSPDVEAAIYEKESHSLARLCKETSRKSVETNTVWRQKYKTDSLGTFSQKIASDVSSDDFYADSCRALAASDKTSLSSIASLKHREDCYFLHYIPDNFVELCFAGLSEYVIRFETIMATTGYRRIESLTINRTPFCSYVNRERKNK